VVEASEPRAKLTAVQMHVAPLRFGLIVDRENASAWQAAVVHALVASGDATIELLVFGHEPVPAQSEKRHDSLWRLYNNRYVARRARCVQSAERWDDLACGAPRVDIEVERRGRWSQHVRADDLERIAAAELDVLFRFGLGILRGPVLDAAKYGVWSFHHDDERVIRGGPPAFWEVNDGLATSGVLLQRLTERLDGGVPLDRATFRTVAHSYARNRDRTFLGTTELPARSARAVRLGVLDPLSIAPTSSDAPIRRNPTNREMVRFFARQSGRAVMTRLRGIVRADVWTIGLARDACTIEGDLELGPVEWLDEMKRDGYLADPFYGDRDGNEAIMVEEFDEQRARGVISALLLTASGWELHSNVLDTGVHSSYPSLVEDGTELYCIPETYEAGRVEAWRSIEFPHRWVRSHVLVDAPVVDPTVFRMGDRWWLLGTLKSDEPDAKLHAWFAPEFAGPWQPHPLNPVKIDAASSRPAGLPFMRNGTMLRPAQDCSTSYGAGVVLNRIVRLDECAFVEEPAGRVRVPPGRYASGTHTLTVRDGSFTIDGRRYGASRYRFLREIRARLRKVRGSR
jgi:hypothetical protein